MLLEQTHILFEFVHIDMFHIQVVDAVCKTFENNDATAQQNEKD